MIKIGVFGSSVEENEEIHEKALEIGNQISLNQAVIVTGGCPGIPFFAVQAAKKNKGYSIGYSAALSLEDHVIKMKTPVHMYDELIFIPENFPFKDNIDVCYKYRNVFSVAASHIALFISGRWGTLNEFSNAYEMGKVIGVLEGTDGISNHVKSLLASLKKKSNSVVIFDKNPKTLISETLKALKKVL